MPGRQTVEVSTLSPEEPIEDVLDQRRATVEEPEEEPAGAELPEEADATDVAEQRIEVPEDDPYPRG